MNEQCLFRFACGVFLLAGPPLAGAQTAPAGTQGFLNNYGQATSIFPNFWKPYVQQRIPLPLLENSPRLRDLIHDGKLELSLADAVALTLENNLDIVVGRYVVPFSQTDILRTKSGQAARGFSGALLPGELSSGAIGAGVTGSGGTGGTGNAGGITGGGGAVSVGPAGAFDPSASFGFSYDRVTSPLNSLVVSGIPTTTSEASSFSFSYAQAFTNGASYSVSLSALRQNTTQQNTLFNPDVTSRLSIGFNQPLLNSRGYLPNMRFMYVARTNLNTAMEVFRQQVIASVAALENAYWDLAAFQLNVQVAQNSLAVSKELLDENRKQEQIGTMSHLDVVTAESQAAAAARDLILAQTNLEQQVTTVKLLISKKGEDALDAATIVVTDQMPQPRESDLPAMKTAFETAQKNRPEIREGQNNLQNQDVAIAYTRNNQLPTLSVFGLAAGSGLQGNTALLNAGAAASLDQTFTAQYPEGAFVAGLLHDAGRLLIALALPEEYDRIMEMHAAGGCTLTVCEQLLLGFSHPDLSAEAIEFWKLPEQIQVAVRDHHSPPRGFPLSRVIDAANQYVNSTGESILIRDSDSANPAVVESLGLNTSDLQALLVEFRAENEAMASYFR